jgi:hypothetical protein
MQHFLYLRPLPQGHGSLRPTRDGFKFIRIGLMGPPMITAERIWLFACNTSSRPIQAV